MKKIKESKQSGNIFTPEWIVNAMLDIAKYDSNHDITCKHVIDNSCGDGKFLTNIVYRYCTAFESNHDMSDDNSLISLQTELETYIHGIELNEVNYKNCLDNLNVIVEKYNFDRETYWDLKCQNALTVKDYDNMMDFIFINPPYVRIHNIDKNVNEEYENYSFVKKGMSDLYLAFFELSFRQSKNEYSKICTITPDSWLTSEAGSVMRDYVFNHLNLQNVYDFGIVQPFKGATTYPIVSLFINDSKTYSGGIPSLLKRLIQTENSYEILETSELFYVNDNKIYFNKDSQQSSEKRRHRSIHVKNGFATLADKIFISKYFTFKPGIIDVCKASTGEWFECIFPYINFSGNIMCADEDFIKIYAPEAYSHLLYNNVELKNRNIDKNTAWYAFGRSQAINDVWKPKYAISQIIKSYDNIKLTYVEPGKGVFGGLYITADKDVSIEWLNSVLRTDKFFDYVKGLRHHKSGGYYSFSSKELEDFLNR